MKASTAQIACISTLINKLGLQADKGNLVIAATGGRTESRGDLTNEEAIWLIQHLKSRDADEKKAEVMRRKIISRAHEMRWYKEGTKKIDMVRIDDWCKKFGYMHKGLNAYTLQELPKLVTQFEAVYTSFLKSL